MSLNNIANFHVDSNKCISCGKCIKVCPGQLLYFDDNKKVKIKDVDCFGWDGCWKCEHCLCVCPVGAVSVLNKSPKDSIPSPDYDITAKNMDALITNRRAHRRYLDKNVDKNVIMDMLKILQNAPNGGNKGLVKYTLIDDKDELSYLRNIIYERMNTLIDKGIYPRGYDKKSIFQLKEWEKIVRPDMLFCSAKHILIPHAKIGEGCYIQDVNIACAYFELLCASRGLGAIPMTFPLDVLELMPDIKSILEIPNDHYISMIIGFGYPEIEYKRGSQKADELSVNILSFKGKQ